MVITAINENNNSKDPNINNNGSSTKPINATDEKAQMIFEKAQANKEGSLSKLSPKGLRASGTIRSKAEKKEADTRALQLAMGTTFKNSYRGVQDMKPMRYTFFTDPEVKHHAVYLLWKDNDGNVFAERLPNRQSDAQAYQQALCQLQDPLEGYLFVRSPI